MNRKIDKVTQAKAMEDSKRFGAIIKERRIAAD